MGFRKVSVRGYAVAGLDALNGVFDGFAFEDEGTS
jgi:hypothetical protein